MVLTSTDAEASPNNSINRWLCKNVTVKKPAAIVNKNTLYTKREREKVNIIIRL